MNKKEQHEKSKKKSEYPILSRHEFQHLDELFVLDVKGVPALDVRAAVGLARKGLAVRHERGGHAGPAEVLVAVEAIGCGQVAPLLVELLVKGVVEAPARPPEEADAELPRRLGQLVKAFPADAEVVEKVLREIRRRAFAHADDAQLRAAHHAHGELWDFALERKRRDQAGAARAEDEEVFDHG